jgi:hypothetical protein
LKKKTKIDTMDEPHKDGPQPAGLGLREVERKNSIPSACRCPCLGYEQVMSSGSENKINKAFDVLFQEVTRIKKSKQINEIGGRICQGFDSPAGGGTNH